MLHQSKTPDKPEIMMKTIIRSLLTILALVSCHSNNSLQIRVEGGLIEGTADEDLAIYKGIPFAAPPIGELRWKAPQPVLPWDGVLETKEFAPSPMQADTTLNTIGVKPRSQHIGR